MINEKLLEIIKELKIQGKTEDQIKEILTGYEVALPEIEEHLKHYSENRVALTKSVFPENYTPTSEKSEPSQPLDKNITSTKKSNFKPLLIVFGIIILGLVIFFLFSNFSKNTSIDNSLDQNTSINDENTSANDQNTFVNENKTLLERFSSYDYPLGQSTPFNLSFTEDEQEVTVEGNIFLKEENTFDIIINTTLSVQSEEDFYSTYGSLSMMAFFYPSFIIPAYNPEMISDPTEFDMFVSGEEYLEIPDDQKLRFFVLKTLYPSDILQGEYDQEVSKFTTAILNPNYNYDTFNISYNIEHDSELFTVFEISLDNTLQEVETKIYNLDSEDVEIEVIPYSELFEDYGSNSQENGSENNNFSGSSFNLGIEFNLPNNTYLVGDTLEGSKYTFSYQGDSFQGRIIYSNSKDLTNTSYSSSKGTIQNGSFDDSLSMLKQSMYTLGADLNPKPFTCNGFYNYSISVYSCQDIDDAMGTDDCGDGGYPPVIPLEDIVMNVEPLDSFYDDIYVGCPDGGVDCCTD